MLEFRLRSGAARLAGRAQIRSLVELCYCQLLFSHAQPVTVQTRLQTILNLDTEDYLPTTAADSIFPFSDFNYLQNCWRRLSPARSIMHGTTSNSWIVSLLLLLLPIVQLLVAKAAIATANDGFDPTSSQPCSLRDAAMDPTYEKRYGVYVVWQVPPNPKGVIYMAHGFNREPLGYFDPGPKCKQCYGLPEHRAMVLEALRREYAVISVKSKGDMYDIFDSPIEASEDLVLVTTIINEWLREHSLETLPLAAWGISAGTPLASALTTKLPMRSLVLMVGEELREVQEMATPSTHPPTMFAYMPSDKSYPDLNITGKDAETMAVLTERGVRVAETQIWPRPIHPLSFTERILCMSDKMSRKIFAALEAAGWLDDSGFLTTDPASQSDTTAMLLKAEVLPICTATGDLCLVLHVIQELQMAFGVHGCSSYANDAMFAWLDSTMLSSSRGGALLVQSE